MSFYPKCINEKGQEALTNNGFIVPCCWIDNHEAREDPRIAALYSEHLKIENIKSRKELLMSNEWIQFFEVLLDAKDLPKTCLRECGDPRERHIRDSYIGQDKIDILMI